MTLAKGKECETKTANNG